MARGLPGLHKNKGGAMLQRGVLCLISVSGAELRLCDSTSGDVAVRFTVEVEGQQSDEYLALVAQVSQAQLGLAGHLRVRCEPIDAGIPAQVIEPHIEAYVLRAVHVIGGVSLAEMANKVVEMELQVPIEFEADTIH